MIATPIGNLKEFSSYALECINNSYVVFCEDTRNTKSLLSKFNIHKEGLSLREHNESSMSNKVIEYLNNGYSICYVSDAGYPAISDPGKILVKKVRDANYPVTTINGSNAMLSALVASSINSEHFYFHGFLNANENKAKEELEALKDKNETLIFYESPHRIKKTLTNMFYVLGNRNITIARELTKINEEFIECTLSEAVEINEDSLIGEMVIVIDGNKEEKQISDETLLKRANYLASKNIKTKDIAEIVSFEFNVNKNYIYDLIIKEK